MTGQKAHRFTHEAMKTVFQLRLCSDDPVIAKNAALACFERLDAIEASLSRYIPGSDVWQINHLRTGESLFINEDSYACLRLAVHAGQVTGGLFDITLGRLIEHRKTAVDGPPPLLSGQLMIDDARPQVHCLEGGREIDLGGIGKGYALDAMAEICRHWDITAGLLSAGASTQLAFGARSWTLSLRGDHHSLTLELQDEALSASGIAVQGAHIVRPDGASETQLRNRAWVRTDTAAMADALSTAALIADDLDALQQNAPAITVLAEGSEGIETV